jgi:DNA invertase Pin-like site-specific DNA recombinase
VIRSRFIHSLLSYPRRGQFLVTLRGQFSMARDTVDGGPAGAHPMVNDLVVRRDRLPSSEKARRAAQYVRMSTEKQQYSIENQAAVIAAYADAHGLKIVETYADNGKSGLLIKNRDGLKRLIADVTSKSASFGHLLVYDVSRWGRFQDTDESAHYEFICREAGVHVEYCAEQFTNDGSIISSIVKNLKRVVAAEKSRELSVKVHAGQCRLARLGYTPGGRRPYALQRILVDCNAQPKGPLRRGERKSLQTDHVRLVPGSADEMAVVSWIFRTFLEVRSETELARRLNKDGVPAVTGRPWNHRAIARILRNESYIGDLVFNKQSRKLKGPLVRNPPDQWIKSEGCIQPIIERELFDSVAKALEDRHISIPSEEMLARLRRLLKREGRLSPRIIDSAAGLPCAASYQAHFGSLTEAYRLIGYTSERNCRYLETRAVWKERFERLASQVAAAIGRSGYAVKIASSSHCLISVRDNFNIYFQVARWRPGEKETFSPRWEVAQVARRQPGWIVATRVYDDNDSVLDYVLIPTTSISGTNLGFTERARLRRGFRRYSCVGALVKFLVALTIEANSCPPTKLAKLNRKTRGRQNSPEYPSTGPTRQRAARSHQRRPAARR